MPRIMNVSPYGDLDVPLLGRIVEAGAVADVSDEQAKILLDQPENFVPVKPAHKKPAAPGNTDKEQS